MLTSVVPPGAEVIDGAGRTLLPGLIDAHTHAFGDALERALLFGVTTELDMFTDHRFAAEMRAEQRTTAGAPGRADIFSAGTLVTAPGGHGTEYGMPIPTIASAAEATAFVDARIAEGSDYIKVVYEDGRSHGLKMPSVSNEVLGSVDRGGEEARQAGSGARRLAPGRGRRHRRRRQRSRAHLRGRRPRPSSSRRRSAPVRS